MTKIDIEKHKQAFLKTEFFMLSWAAATQHIGVWKDISSSNSEEKRKFKTAIKDFLEKKLEDYHEKNVTDDEHIANILELQEKTVKFGNKLNFGICQKLFNMMCKYYWCTGLIEEPPHLPVDKINLQNAGIHDKCWTKDINSKTDYKVIIDGIRKKTEELSLSEWELVNWKRRNSYS